MLLCLMAALPSVAQDWCGSDHYHEQNMKDPATRAAYEAEQLKFDQVAQDFLHQGSRDVDIIPVVFHVIHDNGVGNISRDQLLDGIDVLNEDFRRTNQDASNTRSVFLPFAVDSEIEFRIAQLDPDGNCTDGVNRINSGLTNSADNDVKGLSRWPSNMYMNVWVVENINSASVNGIILGYAQFPGSGSWNNYGIVIRNDRLGRIGTAATNDGRTFTHEVGHCLNLLHTFQSGCGGSCSISGDRVCDTPPVDQSTQGCNPNQNLCSNDVSGPSAYTTDVPDQIENYMSYDDCQNMYSAGQKARMKAALSNYSQLRDLVSASNLAATGTDGNDVLCAADFNTEFTTICVGEAIRFNDQSYNGQTTWNWNFPGGFPSTSTQEDPLIVYNTPGIYDVSLTVGNGVNTTGESKQGYIKVLPSPGFYLPYQEGFESTSIADGEWIISSPNGGAEFKQTNAGAATGLYSIRIDNYNGFDGDMDELASSSFDLSTMTFANLEFKMAYATRTGAEADRLWLSVSTDCGENWQLRWAGAGAAMATAPPHSNSFSPTASEWNTITVPLTSNFLRENFRFRFEFESGGGNNLYIDDINITGTFNPVPILLYPPDASPAEAPDVTLDWKAVIGADFYEYQLDTDPGFVSPNLVSGTLAALGPDPSQADTEIPVNGLTPGQLYYWRVRATQNGAPFSWSNTWVFTVDPNGVGFNELAEEKLNLGVFPNPTSDESFVRFNLDQSSEVRLELIDLMGRQLMIPVTGTQLSAGEHQYRINASELPDGVYLVQLTVGDQQFHQKLVVH
ncbi:MAG: M43 family zinc metalloprotease [Salibacteraceae bacterium]